MRPRRSTERRLTAVLTTVSRLVRLRSDTVQTSDPQSSQYARGDRVFHRKFGYGRVASVGGNRLTINFDKAGEKKVSDNFVTRGDGSVTDRLSTVIACRARQSQIQSKT